MTVIVFFKALEPGERWITVNSGTPQSQPVLVKPEKDGSYRVIGGAGGSLNYLKLKDVKPGESYAAEAKQRAASKREKDKRQREHDRASGLDKSKAAIKEGLAAQLGDQRVKLVQAVAAALGWKPEDLAFPEAEHQNLPESERKAAEKKHAQAIMAKVKEARDFQKHRMVRDGELRKQGGLGEIPLTTSEPGSLSVQDIDPLQPATKGFGFSTEYGKRAGVSKDEVKAEANEVRGKKDIGAAVAKESKAIRIAPVPLDPKVMLEAKQAIGVLKAWKDYQAVEKQVRSKVRELANAQEIEPKGAYVLDVTPAADDAVAQDVANELRTVSTRAFLDQYGKIANGEPMGRFLGVGAFNSINSLALAAGGSALVDRSVVDVLGVAGAAQVLAARFRADLTAKELGDVIEAMKSYHVDHYMKTADDALREARQWQDMAHEIELGSAANGEDLATAQELNAKRRDAVANAQKAIGTALGEMEANAALVAALQDMGKKPVELSLGKAGIEEAITQLRALGLTKADYDLTPVDGALLLKMSPGGLEKLAAPVARDDLQASRDSLAIINGDRDEDNWLPQGMANRPDLAMNAHEGVAPRLAKPFDFNSGNVGQSIGDYIGGRTADGDSPSDIMAGLLSEDVMGRVDRGAFLEALNGIAPIYDDKGQMARVEKYAGTFEKLADDFVERTYGGDRTPIQKQNFKVDQKSMDALHRALTETPEGVAAFKPVGDLTAQDQGSLRKVFEREYAKRDANSEKLRAKVEDLDKQEPAKESEGLFGTEANPDWAHWKRERDAAAEEHGKASLSWNKYVASHASPAAAYAAISDVVRGKVLQSFAGTYNTLSKKPLAVGRQAIAGDLAHLDALDPAAREKRAAERARQVTSMRNRVAGQFSSGSVTEKMEAARESERATEQAQLGMFAAPEPEAHEAAKPLGPGERHTLGQAAERQIAGMMSVVGKNFRPGTASTKIFQPTMSGEYAPRQRAIKLIEQNKRLELGLGVGSGKTAIMLGSFAHLKSQGKTKRGLFAVPSIVQGEFHGAALQFLEPGKFNWHADPGADREARIAAYKDPSKDFVVVTHQAIRDDFGTLLAADGLTPSKFDAMKPAERTAYAKGLLEKNGWDLSFLAVDEGHNLLNRAGKKNSHMANVMDAISGSMEHYVSATADPVKNDASEAFDALAKLHPEKYTDRQSFMRRYGPDTMASKDGLRQEMVRSFYTGAIDPGVKVDRRKIDVDLNADAPGSPVKAIAAAADAARLARLEGRVDVAAMKTLAPYAFQGVDPANEEAVAKKMAGGLDMVANTAMQHAIDDGAKTEAISKLAAERKGKPGVVFVHRLERVGDVARRLKKEGHSVVTLTGGDSTKVKDKKKRDYQAGVYDIMVASDAACVGANLQRGQWLAQYDTPMTAMVHAQRNGRINRIGQKNNVELLDLVANHPQEKRARDRLAKKYGLREIVTSPLDGLDDTGLAGFLKRASSGVAS